jgi:hypothetical protein
MRNRLRLIAISYSPFAVDVKAFSEDYGELSHSVNADAEAETKLKFFSVEWAEAGATPQIALADVPTLYSRDSSAKAFSRDCGALIYWRRAWPSARFE